MQKILIVDGSGLLFQSFYGMPNKIVNNNGQRVEAVVCFLGILLKQIKTINPDNLLVVFDGETHLERKDISPEYKANRPDYTAMPAEDAPFEQLKIIQNVLDCLKVPNIETNTCEADDIIASIVNDYSSKYQIIISSADKDFYQLISPNVSVYTYRGKLSTINTDASIQAKYGFNAKYFATYKCLCGDSADNIKGVSGIGPKTASKLIQTYGDLFNILECAKNNTDKLSVNITQNSQKLLNNYKIIELFSKTGLYKLQSSNFTCPQGSSVQILKRLNLL